MKTVLRAFAAAVALALMTLPTMAQNEFKTPQSGKAVVGVTTMCFNASGQMVPQYDATGAWQCAGSGGGSAATNTAVGSTIASTNTFQTALASSATRKGCLFQNQGANVMYAFFGTLGSATLATAIQVQPGQTLSCASPGGLVLTGNLNATGTSGDAYVVNSQ